MNMFVNQTPKFIPRSSYPGKCILCGGEYTAGAPIYWQNKFASSNPLSKAATWHKGCYENAVAEEGAAAASLYHLRVEGGQASGQGASSQPSSSEPSSSQQSSGQSSSGQGPEASGQGASPQQQPESGNSGQGTETLASQMHGLWTDAPALDRRFHKVDLCKLWAAGSYYLRGRRPADYDKETLCSTIAAKAADDISADEEGNLPGNERKQWLTREQAMRKMLRNAHLCGQQQQQAPHPTVQQAQEKQRQAEEQLSKMAKQAAEAEEQRQLAEQAAKEAQAEAERAGAKSREIIVRKPGGAKVKVEGQHQRMGDLLALVGANVPVLMVGPAGGGKTEAARVVAETLGQSFTPLSLGPQTTQSQVFGYFDATGRYVDTPFRRAYADGGLILLDELDRCNERVSVTLNAAIANGRCSFPDGTVDRHPECVILAAANTAGHGADRQYVSARQQDAALLDRFAVLDWQYDELFETQLAESVCAEHAESWLAEVRQVRARVAELGLRYVVSPRASLQGLQLLASGGTAELARETVLFRGWSPEDRNKVEAES